MHALLRMVEETLAERGASYGGVEDNFAAIGTGWSALLGVEVDAHKVAMMMIWLKVVRESTGTGKLDNYVDIMGYALLGAELRKGEA